MNSTSLWALVDGLSVLLAMAAFSDSSELLFAASNWSRTVLNMFSLPFWYPWMRFFKADNTCLLVKGLVVNSYFCSHASLI